MRHWLQLATRNWRAKPGRTLASMLSVALGVATVVAVTCVYESVKQAIADQVVDNWIGASHISVEPPQGHWGQVPQSLAEPLSKLSNVQHVAVRLRRKMSIILSEPGDPTREVSVDAVGILPDQEKHFREYRGLVGRELTPDDRGKVVIEDKSAEAWGVTIGDTIRMTVFVGGEELPLEIVGTFDTHRVADFQRPMALMPLADLQAIKSEQGQATVIDLMLKDSSPEGIARTSAKVKEVIRQGGRDCVVATAETKIDQLLEAERLTHMMLMLVAFIALLSSFFVIVTTMSVGVFERVGVLGMLRCVGVTRSQTAALVAVEILPIGILGVVLGVPMGFAGAYGVSLLVPAYSMGLAISVWGIWLAVGGGLLTTILAAALLIAQVARVSPIEATTPESKSTSWVWLAVSCIGGVAFLIVHHWMIRSLTAEEWLMPLVAFSGLATLNLGFVFIAPGVVALLGTAMIHVVAGLLGVRRKLARDQIGRSPWRASAVCWMIMVGLSLMVYLQVRSESIIGAWDFPSKLPATFVWTEQYVPRAMRDIVETMPGVGEVTIIADIRCKIGDKEEEATSFLDGLKKGFSGAVPSTFVAGELDRFLSMAKLGFLEGSMEDAVPKLQQGGYVLLPAEAARTYRLGLGDKVTVTYGTRSAEFEVAGVVESPALDVAVTFFQADSYFMLAASAAILGTLDDAERCFGLDVASMFMMNVELPLTEAPADFDRPKRPVWSKRELAGKILAWQDRLPLEREALAAAMPALKAYVADDNPQTRPPAGAARLLLRYEQGLDMAAKIWDEGTPQQRWEQFREQLVLVSIAETIGRPGAVTGSLRRLKYEIDNSIRDATLLVSVMPVLALIVAALGVANLMTVNVSARTRQIAVLRAVGATKSQITRLVLAEALTLGMLGCVVGVLLGLHAADSAIMVTNRLIGLPATWIVPWRQVATSALVALIVCALAGVGPARRAARSNIVEALAVN